MTNVLFVCSQNKLRSPTAEQVFAGRSDLEVCSAGTNSDAEYPLSSELVRWADIIFVMEKAHRAKIRRRYAGSLKSARLICLDIPDQFRFMQPELITLLNRKVLPHLP